jgi:putative sigma-54 modulation protein
MELFIRTHNVEMTEAAKEHIHRRLGFALDRFGNRIRKVRVYLMDLNGPRQGVDKLCQLTILLRGLGRMTVLEKDSTVTSAVSRAARLARGRIAKKSDVGWGVPQSPFASPVMPVTPKVGPPGRGSDFPERSVGARAGLAQDQSGAMPPPKRVLREPPRSGPGPSARCVDGRIAPTRYAPPP